jgi:SpoVK/Ycf46/Vps4 family AAA+-type ATPase
MATANDVSSLPPEMLRKGRFDEIFFVDLPDTDEREQIFGIHIGKRGRDVSKFNLKALAKASAGFSGAEIEQAIVSSLYVAFDAKRELQQKDVLGEVKALVPLSVMMKEDIEHLREWAILRTRPASKKVPA